MQYLRKLLKKKTKPTTSYHDIGRHTTAKQQTLAVGVSEGGMHFYNGGNDPGADIPALHLVCGGHCHIFCNDNELPPPHAFGFSHVSLCSCLSCD
jgi:hypothetical protein